MSNVMRFGRHMISELHSRPECAGEVFVLESDYEALAARLREVERDAARYRWLRDCNTGPAKIASAGIVSDDCNPPYWELKCGDDLDAAIDAARRADSAEGNKHE